ncbi:hypothetical protein AALP_AAs61185U000200 [Arabis alpina]|uniref:Uncharacterized protein n=1 Tax=Arabis alpina TaxID=50452 RepID=A0A087G3W6_ARAAL|nr:hypothetical protein AALP_AAs61185U000200 [Arabis alpina]
MRPPMPPRVNCGDGSKGSGLVLELDPDGSGSGGVDGSILPDDIVLGGGCPDDPTLVDQEPDDVDIGTSGPDDPSLVERGPDVVDIADDPSLNDYGADVLGPETTCPDVLFRPRLDVSDDHEAMILQRGTKDLGGVHGTLDPTSWVVDEEGVACSSQWVRDPRASITSIDGMIPLNDEDPELPPGRADATYSSSSFDLRASSSESDDEDTFVEINPRGIKHLLGIYVLSRECGVVINTEHLSYLTDFRVRGRSEELKHTVTNSLGMALIAGFPSKDDHFEDRFLFVEISERTVEADCIDLVKTRWERRVKPSLPEVSEEFVIAMHTDLSSGKGNRRKSFSRRRIERALSAEVFPGKILGRGLARMSFREQAALEVAAKTRRSSGSSASRVVAPMTSSSTALSVRARPSRPSASKTLLPPPSSGEVAEFRRLSAERARISSGKGNGVDRETPLKRQRVDTFPAAVVGRETSASRDGGLLRDEAYSVVMSKASELSLFFDRLVSDYDEDVRSRDNELGAAKEANAVLQSRLNETVERNEALEHDALALQKVKKDYDDKLAKLKLRCTKAEGEAVQVKALRGRRHPIYDAHDVFADLLASVRRVLEIPVCFAGVAEASVAVDDDVDVSDEDDVEATDDDEDAED